MSIRSNVAAVCLGLAAPAVATAQTQSPATLPMSINAIEQRLAAGGFRVLEIENYPAFVEVKGYDRAGRCTELHLDPRTGDALRREDDDDCSSAGGHDDRRRSHGDH